MKHQRECQLYQSHHCTFVLINMRILNIISICVHICRYQNQNQIWLSSTFIPVQAPSCTTVISVWVWHEYCCTWQGDWYVFPSFPQTNDCSWALLPSANPSRLQSISHRQNGKLLFLLLQSSPTSFDADEREQVAPKSQNSDSPHWIGYSYIVVTKSA